VLPYRIDNQIWLYDIDHILVGVFQKVFAGIEKLIAFYFPRKISHVKSKITARFEVLSRTCITNERRCKKGIFDTTLNQWKSVRAPMRDLPFAMNGIFEENCKPLQRAKCRERDQQLLSLLSKCNQLNYEFKGPRKPWTNQRINEVVALTERYSELPQ